IDGLLELYQATGDLRRATQAVRLTETAVRHYRDDEGGGCFFPADDAEALPVRSKTVRDSATPSASSVMRGALIKLATLLDRRDYRQKADAIVRAFGREALHRPFQAERLLANAQAAVEGLQEVVIVGPADDA